MVVFRSIGKGAVLSADELGFLLLPLGAGEESTMARH
jgi:hypothetical protein